MCTIDFICACFFKSIWTAWPVLKKKSENNSAALTESSAKFFPMTPSLKIGYVDSSWPLLISNRRAKGQFELFARLAVDLFRFSAAVATDATPSLVEISQVMSG